MEFRETQRSSRGIAIVAVVACVLQVALAPQLSILGGRINFMIILSAVLCFTGNADRAVVASFFCGLFYDLTAAVPVGLMALLLTVGSFALANTSAAQVGASNGDSLRLVAAFAVIVSVVYGIILLVMGVQSDILMSIFGHGLTSGILTAIVAIPFMLLSGGSDSSRRGFSARGKGKGTRYKGIR